ncbi:MAG: hypothetical protein Q7K28_03720 [Candidatus Wildermuthbacteria bacterium]|nr:hypothetical protein [Candidatus Wildermuthbacteria bacterium]
MAKKIGILIFVLILAGGGVFYWWNNQKDVRELNKTLPEGVKVVKSLVGNEYKVVNKIDGYEFKVPKEWKGVKEVEYLMDKEQGANGISVKNLNGDMVGIGYYELSNEDKDLDSWVKEWSDRFKAFSWIIEKEKINNLDVVSVKEEKHLFEISSFFFKKDFRIYEINGLSEEFLREIITNGRW